MYLALKGMVPLVDDFGLSMLVGAAYVNQKLDWTGTVANTPFTGSVTSIKHSYYSPMAAASLDYHFDDNLTVFLQYMFIAGRVQFDQLSTGNDADVVGGLHYQRLTLGLNYLFEM